MISDHLTHSVHATLGTTINLFTHGNRYQIICPSNIAKSWDVYLTTTLLSSFCCKCSIILQACITLMALLCQPTVFPWCQSLSVELQHTVNTCLPTTPCNRLKQATPGTLCQCGWMGSPNCLHCPWQIHRPMT